MERLAAKRGIADLWLFCRYFGSPGRCVPVTLAYIRATEASSSRPMPEAAVIRNICSAAATTPDRKSTRLNSSHMSISYAVFCLKKKKKTCRDGRDDLLYH